MTQTTRIAIIDYPHSMQSAVFGLQEMLGLANRICEADGIPNRFEARVLRVRDTRDRTDDYHAVVVPPSVDGDYYLRPATPLLQWLSTRHARGSLICSACAGAFVLAAAGLLDQRTATTHWGLADAFRERFPSVRLTIDKILTRDHDIITAGGLMSWLDLGLELVSHYCTPETMRQLGKQMLVDTAPREQRYYQSFKPRFDHGDAAIREVQDTIQNEFHLPLSVQQLADRHHMSDRTLLRRFMNATGYRPKEYLQRMRVQRACELLESGNTPVGEIAYQVGYDDISSFRKIFIQILGLTPKEFRQRFS